MSIGLRPDDVRKYLADVDGHAQGLYDQMITERADMPFLVAYKAWIDAWRAFLDVARRFETEQDAIDVVTHAAKFATEIDGNPDTGSDGWRQRYERSRGKVVSAPLMTLVRAPIPVEMTSDGGRGIRWYHVAGAAAGLFGLWWVMSGDGEEGDEPAPSAPELPAKDTDDDADEA